MALFIVRKNPSYLKHFVEAVKLVKKSNCSDPLEKKDHKSRLILVKKTLQKRSSCFPCSKK